MTVKQIGLTQHLTVYLCSCRQNMNTTAAGKWNRTAKSEGKPEAVVSLGNTFQRILGKPPVPFPGLMSSKHYRRRLPINSMVSDWLVTYIRTHRTLQIAIKR